MRFLLQIKAWQLFVLMFLMPIVFNDLAASLISSQTNEMEYKLAKLVTLLTLVYWWYFAWIWSAGKGLYERTQQQEYVGSINIFYACIVYSVIFYTYSVIFTQPITITESAIQINQSKSGVMRIAEVTNTFAWFYCMYFVARELVVAEGVSKESERFIEILKLVVLLIMFPIGVWFIQPRLNRQFSNTQKQFYIEM